MTITPATIKDAAIIQSLAAATWPAAYSHIISAGQMEYMLDLMYSEQSLIKQFGQGHSFLLAKDNNEAVAFASYSKTGSPGIYTLHKLYALPSQQGKGLGKKLIEYILNEINKENAQALQLNVNRQNVALKFYERLGFKIISEEDIDIGEGYFMNDYIMEKEVTGHQVSGC